KALNISKTMFKEYENKIRLTLYKSKPVYVIVNKDFDVFIDFYDLEEVFRYRKGIAND
ncbi:MAG: hypothetical protein GX769_00590, partial [Erysipelothrix sp.]|nr:hypothetical protein [Erysipelothrix sp.]